MNNKILKILISFLAVYIIWGSTYLAIRVIVETSPPFISMGIRFISAALLLYIFLFIKGKNRITKKQFINSSLIGILLFAGGTGLVAWSEKYISSGVACVIMSLLPLWFIIFDMIINKSQKPKIIVWIGILLGFLGILLLVGFKDFANMKDIPYLPFFIIIFATILWSIGAILGTKLDKPKNISLNLSIQMFAGGLANFILAGFTNEFHNFGLISYNFESILALIYLITFGSILALSAFTFLIQNVNPGLVSTYSYVNPIVALFLGWLILNEEINSQIIIASALVLTGVAFIKLGDKSITRNTTKRNLVRKKNHKAA